MGSIAINSRRLPEGSWGSHVHVVDEVRLPVKCCVFIIADKSPSFRMCFRGIHCIHIDRKGLI
jgi:hypothetical protein